MMIFDYEEELCDEAERICNATPRADWDKDRTWLFDQARINLERRGILGGVCPTEDHIERGYN